MLEGVEATGLVRRCVECLGLVDTSRDERKMFCCDGHRQAFHNRQTVRGRKLTPLVICARKLRGGEVRFSRSHVGRAARKKAEALIALWIKEDREAGRMPMDEYIELRMRLGITD